MQVAEVYSQDIDEARLIFGRKGTKVVKKYRCTFAREAPLGDVNKSSRAL